MEKQKILQGQDGLAAVPISALSLAVKKARLDVMRVELTMPVGEGTYAAAKRAVLLAQERLLAAEIVEAEHTKPQHGVHVNLNDYVCGGYPRAGCTLVIQLTDGKWDMTVFAPGFSPGGKAGVIESYVGRPYGSAGIAVDAFIGGKSDWRPLIPAMVRAEKAYVAAYLAGSPARPALDANVFSCFDEMSKEKEQLNRLGIGPDSSAPPECDRRSNR